MSTFAYEALDRTHCTISSIQVNLIEHKFYTDDEEYRNLIDKAVEFIKKNPEEVRKIIAKSMFIDSAIASKMNIMPNTLSKEIDFQNLDDYIQLLKTNGFINSTPKAKEICVKSIN